MHELTSFHQTPIYLVGVGSTYRIYAYISQLTLIQTLVSISLCLRNRWKLRVNFDGTLALLFWLYKLVHIHDKFSLPLHTFWSKNLRRCYDIGHGLLTWLCIVYSASPYQTSAFFSSELSHVSICISCSDRSSLTLLM